MGDLPKHLLTDLTVRGTNGNKWQQMARIVYRS